MVVSAFGKPLSERGAVSIPSCDGCLHHHLLHLVLGGRSNERQTYRERLVEKLSVEEQIEAEFPSEAERCA